MSDTQTDTPDRTDTQAFTGGLAAYLEMMQELHGVSDAEVAHALQMELRRRGESDLQKLCEVSHPLPCGLDVDCPAGDDS